MTRVAAALSALRGARWTDLRDVAEAQAALLRAELLRRLRPAGALVEPITSADIPVRASPEECEAYARFSLAVDRAARYGVFRPQCLASALALSGMLADRGFGAHRIRIGVRKDDSAFTAHAWVELQDVLPENSSRDGRGYTALTTVSLRRWGGVFPRGDPAQCFAASTRRSAAIDLVDRQSSRAPSVAKSGTEETCSQRDRQHRHDAQHLEISQHSGERVAPQNQLA